MTVPKFSAKEFINYMKSVGCIVASTEYWNDFNRLVIENPASKIVYVFEYRDTPPYFFMEIVKICKLLKISPPEECLHSYYRHCKLDDENCYCESGMKFKEYHGVIE